MMEEEKEHEEPQTCNERLLTNGVSDQPAPHLVTSICTTKIPLVISL